MIGSQFYEPSPNKQDVDLAPVPCVPLVLTLFRKCSYLRAFWYPPLSCDIGGMHDGTIFIRSFSRVESSFDLHPFSVYLLAVNDDSAGYFTSLDLFYSPETKRPDSIPSEPQTTPGDFYFLFPFVYYGIGEKLFGFLCLPSSRRKIFYSLVLGYNALWTFLTSMNFTQLRPFF